jgi:Rad3-related DNA helicase
MPDILSRLGHEVLIVDGAMGTMLQRAGMPAGQCPEELNVTNPEWEGFDAKGDTLRCVVIARLPFGRVRDPLYEERQDRFGRRAWDDFYLPEAVLELKQAAGRLVRSSSDEGCVVVADGRLAGGKGYARRFLEALPVSDVEIVGTDELIARVRERFGR